MKNVMLGEFVSLNDLLISNTDLPGDTSDSFNNWEAAIQQMILAVAAVYPIHAMTMQTYSASIKSLYFQSNVGIHWKILHQSEIEFRKALHQNFSIGDHDILSVNHPRLAHILSRFRENFLMAKLKREAPPDSSSSRKKMKSLPQSEQVCFDWNNNRCKSSRCPRKHECSKCGGAHVNCRKKAPDPAKETSSQQ
jgi:hypothetical protein